MLQKFSIHFKRKKCVSANRHCYGHLYVCEYSMVFIEFTFSIHQIYILFRFYFHLWCWKLDCTVLRNYWAHFDLPSIAALHVWLVKPRKIYTIRCHAQWLLWWYKRMTHTHAHDAKVPFWKFCQPETNSILSHCTKCSEKWDFIIFVVIRRHTVKWFLLPVVEWCDCGHMCACKSPECLACECVCNNSFHFIDKLHMLDAQWQYRNKMYINAVCEKRKRWNKV